MLVRSKPGWEIPQSIETPESTFLERRLLVKAMAAAPILAAGAMLSGSKGVAANTDMSARLYPAARNSSYSLDRPLNTEKEATTYNNFYEFGSHKYISKESQALKIRPWTVTFDGMVEKEITIDVDTLIAKMQLEERLYRFRCVEAWSMALPWTGFPMADLVKFARPLKGAKFVMMETFHDPAMAKGQKQFWYPWPYREGLTLEEATNELALIGTGAYGKPLAKQMGAPLRLVVPWKYGFKSIKSIVRFSFTNQRPVSFWEKVQGKEYGFWANVNPDVPHARWSQETERVLGGTGKRLKTLLYNGYGEQVAGLYKNVEGQNIFY
jgi:sulfoxide reductase catalytic subunit YedY